jgi:signal recognition particle receptor subunit alpha
MEEDEIQSVLEKLKDLLMSKNVAEEIAQKLCESMKSSLLEKKTGMFQSV